MRAGSTKPKLPAKRKRSSAVQNDDYDSVPIDSSGDGKQLTLMKVKKAIDRHAKWCPFVRINKKILNRHKRLEAFIVNYDSDSDSDDDDQKSKPATKRDATKKSDPKSRPADDGEDENDADKDERHPTDKQTKTRSKQPHHLVSEANEDGKRDPRNDQQPLTIDQSAFTANKAPSTKTQMKALAKLNPPPTKASKGAKDKEDAAQPQKHKTPQSQPAKGSSDTKGGEEAGQEGKSRNDDYATATAANRQARTESSEIAVARPRAAAHEDEVIIPEYEVDAFDDLDKSIHSIDLKDGASANTLERAREHNEEIQAARKNAVKSERSKKAEDQTEESKEGDGTQKTASKPSRSAGKKRGPPSEEEVRFKQCTIGVRC